MAHREIEALRRQLVADTVDRIQVRLRLLDVFRPTVEPCGPDQICLTARGTTNPDLLIAAAGRPGRLELRLIDEQAAAAFHRTQPPADVSLQRETVVSGDGSGRKAGMPFFSAPTEAALRRLSADRLPPQSQMLVGRQVDPRSGEFQGYRSWVVEREPVMVIGRLGSIRIYRHRSRGCYVHAELHEDVFTGLQGLMKRHGGRRLAVVLDGKVNGVAWLDKDRCSHIGAIDVCLGALNLFPPAPPGSIPQFDDARVLSAQLESGPLPVSVAIVDISAQ